jgi:hypothetical protein
MRGDGKVEKMGRFIGAETEGKGGLGVKAYEVPGFQGRESAGEAGEKEGDKQSRQP